MPSFPFRPRRLVAQDAGLFRPETEVQILSGVVSIPFRRDLPRRSRSDAPSAWAVQLCLRRPALPGLSANQIFGLDAPVV